MIYNKIENTDLNLSQIALGSWVFGGDVWQGSQTEDSIAAIHCALDSGVNFIDTAPAYGAGIAEEIIGKAIKGRRKDVVIATKCGLVGKAPKIRINLSAQSIMEEIELSLKRLNIEYIDIYQCHWPDPNATLEETMTALTNLQEQGKIRYIGVSNFTKSLLDEASDLTRIITSQNQYSVLNRDIEKEILPTSLNRNIGILAYGPLAGGILTGKYKVLPQFKGPDARKFFYKYYSNDNFIKVQDILHQLSDFGKPLNEVAINWVRQQKGIISVLCGCRNSKQVKENVNAVSWELDQDQLLRIGTKFCSQT